MAEPMVVSVWPQTPKKRSKRRNNTCVSRKRPVRAENIDLDGETNFGDISTPSSISRARQRELGRYPLVPNWSLSVFFFSQKRAFSRKWLIRAENSDSDAQILTSNRSRQARPDALGHDSWNAMPNFSIYEWRAGGGAAGGFFGGEHFTLGSPKFLVLHHSF